MCLSEKSGGNTKSVGLKRKSGKFKAVLLRAAFVLRKDLSESDVKKLSANSKIYLKLMIPKLSQEKLLNCLILSF